VSRARTGTLVPPGRDGIWKARVTADDGSRPLYSLGTTDEGAAKRKLARLVAGELPDEISDDTVRDYAIAWNERRKTQGVGMAKKELRNLEMHVFEAIGRMPIVDVKPMHVRGILDAALAKGLRRHSLSHIRGVMHRLFRSAVEDDMIENNPVAPARTPKTREVRRERTILTDEEFTTFVSCAGVSLELRMLALVARCEGGMRTGDLNQWDWSMIDRVHFAECFIPRSKTRTPQRLAIPEALTPFLRAWWERGGVRESGPVFPATHGKRAGKVRSANGLSFSKRLRKALIVAGVFRLPPKTVTRNVRTGRGENTRPIVDVVPDARDPLYNETSSTRPVDFHSFRRAFNTALAEVGVNVQHAMHLASHSDPKVHARYVMSTAAMREIPSAALPRLPSIVTTRDDSNIQSVGLIHQASQNMMFGSAGEEIRTPDLARMNQAPRSAMRDVAPTCASAPSETCRIQPACFTVRRDDSSESSQESVQSTSTEKAVVETMHIAPTLEVLRAKLDAAILAEAWSSVSVIAARIREIERAAVVDLDRERARREK
jgi:integrase